MTAARVIVVIASLLAGQPAFAQSVAAQLNDYPTEARAEYVFACMAVNGQTRDALSRCSCSIDVIASILTYKQYVSAETVLALRQTSGERVSLFRSAAPANAVVLDLRRAEAEAEIRCF